jgi:hypothetical protein
MLPKQLSYRKLSGERFASSESIPSPPLRLVFYHFIYPSRTNDNFDLFLQVKSLHSISFALHNRSVPCAVSALVVSQAF